MRLGTCRFARMERLGAGQLREEIMGDQGWLLRIHDGAHNGNAGRASRSNVLNIIGIDDANGKPGNCSMLHGMVNVGVPGSAVETFPKVAPWVVSVAERVLERWCHS